MARFWDKLIKRASLRALENLAADANYDFVRQNQIFKDLSAEAFLFIMESLIERRFKADEVIFQEGNPGVCLFLLRAGRVEVFTRAATEGGETRTVFSVLEPGALFGELSIISDSYRTTSARALDSETVLLALSRFDVERLLQRYPQDGVRVLRGVTDWIIARLIDTDRRLREVTHELQLTKERLARHD